MSTAELRRQAKKRIDQLSPERVRVANDFLAYLQDRESVEATAELLQIPGLLEKVKQGMKDYKEGKTVPWRQVRRKR